MSEIRGPLPPPPPAPAVGPAHQVTGKREDAARERRRELEGGDREAAEDRFVPSQEAEGMTRREAIPLAEGEKTDGAGGHVDVRA